MYFRAAGERIQIIMPKPIKIPDRGSTRCAPTGGLFNRSMSAISSNP